MKNLTTGNKYLDIAIILILLYLVFFNFPKIVQYFKNSFNQLSAANIQPPANAGGNGSGGNTTNPDTQPTIGEGKAREYAARVVADVDEFFTSDDNVYIEMLALKPADLVLINNAFLTNFTYPYKTIAEFIRAKSAWLTDAQEKFLVKFDASLKF